jgi:hypothetical protein
MRLRTATPSAESDDVLAAEYILRAGQFQHQGLVERWDGGEVEAVETLNCREPGLLDPALDGPSFAVDHLKLGQAQQVARVIDPLGGAHPELSLSLRLCRAFMPGRQPSPAGTQSDGGGDTAPAVRP